MKDKMRVLIFCGLISCGSSLLSIVLYHHFFAMRIAALDTSAYLKQVREDYLSRKISPKELEEKLEQVVGLIRNQPQNKIILTADVVLSKNVEVITP